MKAATAKEIKDELAQYSQKDLLKFCLRLSRFKKENKELLTYLLFEAGDEGSYIMSIKEEMDQGFAQINRKTNYLMKKSIRKILRNVRKFIRYSGKKETEVELLLYFCEKLSQIQPSIQRNRVLRNLYDRLIQQIKNNIPKLHEDLQYDFQLEWEALQKRSNH